MANLNYLITGGAGFVGSTLVDHLIKNNHYVKVVDKFFFNTKFEVNNNLEILNKDVRELSESDFKDIDIVIDLASISNDPSGELNPYLTYQINGETRGRTAGLAKKAGVSGYILASSCSVYGFSDKVVDENSSVNPLTTYAYANLLAEKLVLSQSDKDFHVLVFRQATLFGVSKRMRIDLVVNGMIFSGIKNGNINILRDGNQKRPILSLNELNNRFLSIDERVFKKYSSEIFNIGNDDLNLSIKTIYEKINTALGGNFEKNWYGEPDFRSYHVSFNKSKTLLPTIEAPEFFDEVEKISEFILNNEIDEVETNTLKWYQSLMKHNPEILNYSNNL
tara:strand:+ start:4398 stop:5402 length:1005 start_codon:yes stop_codon:yes gene_type:complete